MNEETSRAISRAREQVDQLPPGFILGALRAILAVVVLLAKQVAELERSAAP